MTDTFFLDIGYVPVTHRTMPQRRPVDSDLRDQIDRTITAALGDSPTYADPWRLVLAGSTQVGYPSAFRSKMSVLALLRGQPSAFGAKSGSGRLLCRIVKQVNESGVEVPVDVRCHFDRHLMSVER